MTNCQLPEITGYTKTGISKVYSRKCMFAPKALLHVLEATAKIEKDSDRVFVAVNKPEKEIFIIDYDAYNSLGEGEEPA